jgi:hypothetical protein
MTTGETHEKEEKRMKRLLTFAITMFLGATLALAQTGGDKNALNPQPLPPGKKATATTSTKTNEKGGKKGHKGGKKGKKGSSTTTTPPPK